MLIAFSWSSCILDLCHAFGGGGGGGGGVQVAEIEIWTVTINISHYKIRIANTKTSDLLVFGLEIVLSLRIVCF